MESAAGSTENVETTPARTGVVIDATKDAEYVVDSYANALYAIKAAEIVKQRTTRDDIKSMAEKIEATNKKVFSELDKLASVKKISLPSNLNMAQITDLNKLANDTANTGKLFLQQMENEHKEGMELLEKISKESEDNEITTVAISCLATVKSQYDEVVATKERLDL
jgi:predicted outer membrane protein